jgi:pseudaminic acid synthase
LIINNLYIYINIINLKKINLIKKLNSLNSPFFVAEISANHNGSLEMAKLLIKTAKKNGADAVKLQTYTPDTITIKSNREEFNIKHGIWRNYTLWELYDKAQTPFEWHKELFAYAKKLGIICFSSPFDETAVDLLENLNCPIYKLASFELNHIPLIKKISKTKKPIIISTGTGNINEIETAFKTAKKYGAQDITLLYCVSNYPSKVSDFNLNNIKILKSKFNCRVGFSDHSNDYKIASAAAFAGAEVFEKHIALEGQKKGFDIKFSLKGSEIKAYKKTLLDAFSLLGKKNFFRNKTEKKNYRFKRSIYSIKNIKKGDNFNSSNIKVIRPYNGLEPIYYEKLLKKKSPIFIKGSTPLKKNLLKRLKIIK